MWRHFATEFSTLPGVDSQQSRVSLAVQSVHDQRSCVNGARRENCVQFVSELNRELLRKLSIGAKNRDIFQKNTSFVPIQSGNREGKNLTTPLHDFSLIR